MVLKKWFVIVFAPPGNCKSLEQARLSYNLIKEYYKFEKKYPQLQKRFLYTNQYLNPKIEIFAKALTDRKLLYWDSAEQLKYCPVVHCYKGELPHLLHDCDLFCDEGATLFPATGKGQDDDMPMWLKKMLAQHRHNSVRVMLLTQDFMSVNIMARRVCWEAWLMEKVIGSRDPSPSLPPVRFIWGVYRQRKIDPELVKKDVVELRLIIKGDKKKKEELQKLKLIGLPKLHLITKFKCFLFDTLQNVKEFRIKRDLEHIEVACKHVPCGYVHKTHKLK